MKERLHNEELMQLRLRKGDEIALRELVDLYRPQMLMEAYYILRDMHEAEDLVQEVFIRFWSLRHKVELKPSFSAYLSRAVRYECIIKIKKERVREKRQQQYGYFMESSVNMQPFENAELASKLNDAMQEIPPAARKSFMMSYMEDKSQKAIAEEQNISLQVVKNNISKALKILRQKLHPIK
jgi:RNA polymerase sigma-70 factor (ECF subfamily)